MAAILGVLGAFLAAEQRRRFEQAPPACGVRLTVEVLAYLGGTLASVGAILLAARTWPGLATWTRLSLVALAAVVLWRLGAVLQERTDPSVRRLRGVVWLLSAAAIAFLTGLVASEVLDLQGDQVAFLVGLVTAAYALALWRLQPRPLQQLACLAGLATATAAGVAAVGGDAAAAGLSVWTVGVLWSLAGWLGRLPPPTVALASGAVTMLVGAQISTVGWESAGLVFGLVSVLALLVAGATGRRFAVAGIGIAGVFVYLPWTVLHFFAGMLGVPVVILLCGAVLLTMAWMMLRSRWRQAPKA